MTFPSIVMSLSHSGANRMSALQAYGQCVVQTIRLNLCATPRWLFEGCFVECMCNPSFFDCSKLHFFFSLFKNRTTAENTRADGWSSIVGLPMWDATSLVERKLVSSTPKK